MKQQFSLEAIVTAVCLLLIAALTYLVAMPQASNLKADKALLAQKKGEELKLQSQKDALEQAANDLVQYAPDLERLKLAFPATDQQVEALVQAQAITAKTGVTVTSLSPSKPKAGDLPIAFGIKGSYSTIITFLRELNNNLRPIVVQTVNIVPGGDKDANVLTANISTAFEFSGTAAPAAKSATPATDGTADLKSN